MLTVNVCWFQRGEHYDMEQGVMIDEDKLIIDMNGLPVPAPVWDYSNRPELGCMIVHHPK